MAGRPHPELRDPSGPTRCNPGDVNAPLRFARRSYYPHTHQEADEHSSIADVLANEVNHHSALRSALQVRSARKGPRRGGQAGAQGDALALGPRANVIVKSFLTVWCLHNHKMLCEKI